MVAVTDPQDLANATRRELRSRVLDAYGDLKRAAAATGIPYKTMYRNLTLEGTDRPATISLQFVLSLITHMEENFGGDGFATFYAHATRKVQ